MHLPLSRDLAVGKLGTHPFETGYYLYFGSALNSLEGRLRRHLRSDKKLHWHIDFLSAKATIEAIWWLGALDTLAGDLQTHADAG